ncbi:MAG: hypothetical protein IJR13_03370 [Bacteroidales bacterium]|nr:hypothetical protein [Bacteroidales bacterium]
MKQIRVVIVALLMLLGYSTFAQCVDDLGYAFYEVKWQTRGVSYLGLIEIFPPSYEDNYYSAFFIGYYYHPQLGRIDIIEKCSVSFQVNNNGCYTYVVAWSVVTNPPTSYLLDSFTIYPNGTMFVSDVGGNKRMGSAIWVSGENVDRIRKKYVR